MNANAYWYDSQWLQAFRHAQTVIARVAPDKLAGFIGSFDVLRTDPDFSVRQLPGIFDEAAIRALRETISAIPRQLLEMHEMRSFGRFIVHDYPAFTALQATLVDQVSAWAGEPVEPYYNFLSLYTRMGNCDLHLDAPLAKWTLDVCVDQSHVWPIHFSQVVPWPEFAPERALVRKSDPALQFTAAALRPGDAVLFSGSSQWHYRDAFRDAAGTNPAGRTFCDLLFFHYIPKGTLRLINPNEWADLFGITELALTTPFDMGK